MEKENPGLWRRWFKHQCVTVGYSPEMGFQIMGGKRPRDWIVARNALREIQTDDVIVAALPGRRVGRIGKVLDKKFKDEDLDPLVPGDSKWKKGYMGRRIFVHWELERAPDSPDQVVQLPEGVSLGRGTMHRIKHHKVEWFRDVIAEPANWVGMVGRFGYERALSDYIALYPHRLEDGLVPYSDGKVRERVFKDRTRSDVLLLDKDDKPVIVECKQESPTVEDVRQLRHYLRHLKQETGKRVRGKLVHGGAKKVDRKVWREAQKSGVEIFQYRLDVDFAESC
jgi:hypothetical protein